MAERESRLPENVPGKFYVDEQCIDCGLCYGNCPNCFKREENNGYSYVSKQPDTAEERELCAEAMESCPVNAIGDDGAA
ncbi:MAG: ferredoxin [Puniceicoccales bacterium]|jgi:ferredoxin|nr:ferredoxin [Puniceicoccales bacterium]